MEQLSEAVKLNVSETLSDFKSLLGRYRQVKGNETLLKKFCSRNRNPLWDISNSKYFNSNLLSEEAKKSFSICNDHYIQRTKAVELLFRELDKDPDMSYDKFLLLLKKFCSTVKITKEEHSRVSSYCKKNKDSFNYEAYLACGIKISGLSELILS